MLKLISEQKQKGNDEMRDPMQRLIKPSRWPRRLLIVMVALLMFITGLPYVLPLSSADAAQYETPYDNGYFAEIDGIKLHYRIWQNPDQDSKGQILLIHGLGGSTYSWELTAPALRDAGYRVVAVDLPGFGYSSRQPGVDHSQRNRARLLWLLSDQIQASQAVDDRSAGWILAGHSMGAGTAAAMAMARPEQTRQLIIIDGALNDQQPTAISRLLAVPPFGRWLALALEHVLITRNNVENLLTSTHGQPPSADRLNAYLVPLRMTGTASALVDFTRTARSEPLENLAILDLPVKAIWGANDTIIPLAEADRLRQIVPASQLWVIPDAGHLPMETHADEFNQLLIHILEG